MRTAIPRLVLAMTLVHAGTAATPTAEAQEYPGALKDLRVAKGRQTFADVWFTNPTTRYRHFVLGAPYEAASISTRLIDGRTLKLTLAEDSVFEDRQPRIAVLDASGEERIVAVRSYLARGATLSVIGIKDGTLQILAETPPTGRPNTWINPAGIADFDGDGQMDIAIVQMPHVLGRLRVWTLRAGKLTEIASLDDVSNHVIGSAALGLSAVADFTGDGVADLAIPSLDRTTLRLITFKGGVREVGRKPLPARAAADFKIEKTTGMPEVNIGLEGGSRMRVRF